MRTALGKTNQGQTDQNLPRDVALTSPKLAMILALETSCDETAAAVFYGEQLLSSEVTSQIEIHAPYGGVVPEVASREHIRALRPVVDLALKKAGIAIGSIDAVAATCGPGLASSLMIGTSIAKGLAVALGRPFLAINHLEGHLLSPFFGTSDGVSPSVGLIVSGGHTLLIEVEKLGEYKLLGQTQDDAAGEAFDKVGKLLGLPYPGGPHLDRIARNGDPAFYDFPRSMISTPDYHFSFSGLKTAVRYLLPRLESSHLPDVCASFQEAVVDVLISKTIRAAQAKGLSLIAVSGGVSCNTRLREKLLATCATQGLRVLLAPPKLCTDNAAMIGYVAALRWSIGATSAPTVDIDPNLRLAT